MPEGPRLRQALAELPSYRAGRPAAPGGHKLSSNENPYPPLPGVLEVVADAAAQLSRYPDFAASDLVAAIARHHDVPAEMVATGTGSVAVLGQLLDITVDPGDEVVFAWRSFEAYPIFATLKGARAVRVPLTASGRHDLTAMAAAIGPRTRLVLLCTPNNPTGPALHSDELDEFLARVPPDVLVVLDEAYCEFVRDTEAPDGLDYVRRNPSVVSLRTFSKAYGLAGLRVGYAIAAPAIADALRKAALPFGVNLLAQAAAVASLGLTGELLRRVDDLVVERARVLAGLRAEGFEVPDAQGNFVWLKLGALTGEFAEACESAGLSVRAFSDEGVRVTVGSPDANDLFLRTAGAWQPAHATA